MIEPMLMMCVCRRSESEGASFNETEEKWPRARELGRGQGKACRWRKAVEE